MVVLGLLIVLIAIGVGAALYIGAASLHGTFTFDVVGAQISTNPVGLTLAGALVVLLLWLGWSLLRLGTRRSTRRRRAAKEAERQAEVERDEAERRQQEEHVRREEETQALRQEAQSRVDEQHLATETARQRAQVAEDELRRQGESSASTPPGEGQPPA